MSDRAKIRNRRVSGNDVQQQRDIANAIKNAREMALLPYTRRVSDAAPAAAARRPPRARRATCASQTGADARPTGRRESMSSTTLEVDDERGTEA